MNHLRIDVWSPRDPSHSDLINQSYQLWHRVWAETFKKLDGIEEVYSDDFDRQDLILSLSESNEVVGLICQRYRDMRMAHWVNDSYFRQWPEVAVKSLQRDGHRLCFGSNITVHPSFRGRNRGYSVKDLLMKASLLYHRDFKPVDAITGTMRTDKNMAALFYQLGAESLCRNVEFHGVPVDLLGFFPQTRGIQLEPSDVDLINPLFRFGSSTAA